MKAEIALFYACATLCAMIALFGCGKTFVEPDLNGTWAEIDSTTTQNLTGCELVIDENSGDVILCGVQMVHPYNAIALPNPDQAKLVTKNGQMYYKQQRGSFLLIDMPGNKKHYFLDYEFDGSFLWIIGDNTETFVPAKNNGRVFKKK
ncbi:MAG: hypothetical protein FD123_1501 [Bacteroidetes bacterium]|nr:MAG: hypothetical protein FD123_1501 [Bacteroidota bacterium]